MAPDPVVTGDEVVLDVQFAQLPVRAVAALIDLAVVVVCYVIGLLLLAAASARYDEALTTAIMGIVAVAVVVGEPEPLPYPPAPPGSSAPQRSAPPPFATDRGFVPPE